MLHLICTKWEHGGGFKSKECRCGQTLTMKDLDRSGGGRQGGRSKDEPAGDNKSDPWMEGKEASYRGARRRESRWDEPDTTNKRAWHNSNEERTAPPGQRLRGREWSEVMNDISEDGRDGDRREDHHHRRAKDVVESNREDVESWDRSSERRRDHRDEEDRTADRRKSSKDGDDGIEGGRGRPSAKIQDEDEDYGDKSRSKDDFYWEEPDDRRRGWKSSKLGQGVKRQWSPDLRRRGRVEHDDFEREWSDDRRDDRVVYRRDYDRDRDRYQDRDVDFYRERDRDFRNREVFREESDFFRDRTREREDLDRRKHRQRDRQKEKEDDAEYNYERDGWEVPRREKEKAERDQKSEDRKDKDRIDVLKSPQSSGIIGDTMERVGGNSAVSIDLARERGFGTSSPFLSRRGDGGPPGEFIGSNGDIDWMGDERTRPGEGDYRDRSFFEEEGPPGLDQSFGPISSRFVGDGSMAFNIQSVRGRTKGSPGQRGRGGAGGGDGRPPFANNQGLGMVMRGTLRKTFNTDQAKL